MQATHLVFYHERSARQGVRRLMERAEQHPHMLKEYPGLQQLLHFSGDECEFRFPEINQDYFSISSHEFAKQNGVLTDTFVDVVARNK
jgi:hypothetical protein